jgi:hypothetical protein
MNDLGRLLIGVGLVLVIAGGLLLLLGRTGFPLGRLPGDISYRGRNVSVYFPLGTSILLSVVLSLIFYLLSRFRRLGGPDFL